MDRVKEKRSFDPTNDLVFKFVFGHEERKHITLQFINDMLGREGSDSFRDIQFRNTELTPLHEGDKLVRLDVFGLLHDGTRVNIEMQVLNRLNMEQRSLFYWAQMYLQLESLRAGESYEGLKPAIAINILRYAFLPQEDAHACYGIYNPETGHRLTSDLEIHFLELAKYERKLKKTPKAVRNMSRMERWMAYFSNRLSKEDEEELAMDATDAAIRDAIEASERFVMDDANYRAYLAREAAIYDYNNDMIVSRRLAREEGLEEGREEGRAEGRAEGRRDGKLDMVRSLLAHGASVELIEAASGLAREEILALAAESGKEGERV